ncbi:hypothetical protein Tco_1111785 [Tanacetum coccineum]|uniref:Uncharacterized protein n=1 Tax=Tanacetum coccineum TaxID=301880 RepID=A0ABQ5IMQ8_9ASTR
MANTQTPFHPDQSSHITYLQHPQPNNNFVLQPSYNANYMQQSMQNPEDISDPTTAIDMELVLMAKAFTLNDTTPTNNTQRSSSNPSNMQIAQPGMNMDQDRQMLMVEDNVGNQFRLNAIQNVKNQVVLNAVQNPGVQNVRNQNGLSVDPGIANQYRIRDVVTARAEGNGNGINGNQIRCYNCQGEIAQKEEAGIQLTQEEFDFMADAGACEEIEKVNANCTSRIICSKHRHRVLRLTKLPSMSQTYQLSMEQDGGTVEQHPATVEETQEKKKLKSDFKIREDELLDKQIQLENKIKELDNILQAHQKQQSLYNGKVLLEKHDPPVVYDSEETLQLAQEKATKFVRDFKSLAKEADESLAKHKALELEIERLLRAVVTYNDMKQKITRLQAQLGDLKGKSKDTPCVSDTLDPLSQKLENKNVELEFQTKLIIDSLQQKLHDTIYENATLRAQLFDKVSKQKDTIKGTCVNTQFSKQSILGKPPSSSKPKMYDVTPLPQSMAFPKVGESNALSKPVTLNSALSPRESIVVNNERVIAPGIFRINPFKDSRVANFVLNKHVKASVRTKPITVSQPHVITNNDVNSKTNGFSPKDVKSTTRTRRPQPRNNLKNDKVPSKSKSSCLSHHLDKIEENHRNLQSSSNQKHTSFACNNIKLAVRNKLHVSNV